LPDRPSPDRPSPDRRSKVIIYWRPMCGYCDQLKGELARRGVAFSSVDIWKDRSQADVVRAATGGDEVVPTVQVGTTFLVNPSADAVEDALRMAS
jgi:mycoredoxin